MVADLDGEQYLVSMFGESSGWVRNVRAAHGVAVLRHGARDEVHLEEVAPEERPPILKRYLELAPGAQAHIQIDPDARLADFEQVAGNYPVFRILSSA